MDAYGSAARAPDLHPNSEFCWLGTCPRWPLVINGVMRLTSIPLQLGRSSALVVSELTRPFVFQVTTWWRVFANRRLCDPSGMDEDHTKATVPAAKCAISALAIIRLGVYSKLQFLFEQSF
jgi:hypothetical protein